MSTETDQHLKELTADLAILKLAATSLHTDPLPIICRMENHLKAMREEAVAAHPARIEKLIAAGINMRHEMPHEPHSEPVPAKKETGVFQKLKGG